MKQIREVSLYASLYHHEPMCSEDVHSFIDELPTCQCAELEQRNRELEVLCKDLLKAVHMSSQECEHVHHPKHLQHGSTEICKVSRFIEGVVMSAEQALIKKLCKKRG